MQNLLTQPGTLLDSRGCLNQVGWSPQPLLDCNLENARFYRLTPFQRFRLKRWDYYALFTPGRFFSATIADLGYAGNVFVYTLDYETGDLWEEGLVIPLARGVSLPRNSTEGDAHFENARACLDFKITPTGRHVSVHWPGFHAGRGIQAEIDLLLKPEHESMNIVIPIGRRRFYFNRKVNCLPAEGSLRYGSLSLALKPTECLGSLDWGRGVWDYRSFWNWASASGYLPDGRTLGLNLGCGFGDTSAATEDALILDGRIHKLGAVKFEYDPSDYMKPWRFTDREGRLDVTLTPFKVRVARTNLGVIFSEVHQTFGRYSGFAVSDEGERIAIRDLVGFTEEHHARW